MRINDLSPLNKSESELLTHTRVLAMSTFLNWLVPRLGINKYICLTISTDFWQCPQVIFSLVNYLKTYKHAYTQIFGSIKYLPFQREREHFFSFSNKKKIKAKLITVFVVKSSDTINQSLFLFLLKLSEITLYLLQVIIQYKLLLWRCRELRGVFKGI